MVTLVMLMTLVSMVSSSPHLLVLDQTRCYSGCGAEQCRDPVVGADQVVKAVNWTLERMLSPGNTQEAHSGLYSTFNNSCFNHFQHNFYSNPQTLESFIQFQAHSHQILNILDTFVDNNQSTFH